MPYTRPYANGFVDYPDVTTPITASVLNTMDVGIKTANDQIQSGTFATRPASPSVGNMFYQTDTDELIKYVTDLDGQNRWMAADHDYRRSFVINGGFDVWQRGTSFNPTSATSTTGANYGADRWQFLQATSNASGFTRQAIASTDPAGYNYYLRVQRANTATFTTAFTVQTSFESLNIEVIRGKYVTLSFWARAGANYSAASSYLVSNIVTGTGTDNTVGNFTTNTVNTTTNNVLTTSWKRFVITTSAALATTITQLGISFVFTPVGTAGAADYFDITGVQLEAGTVPSDFEPRDYGEELRRCQRYFYQTSGSNVFSQHGFAMGTSGTGANGYIPLPVTMRTTPTATQSGIGLYTAALVAALTNIAVDANSNPSAPSITYTVASGAVSGTTYRVLNNNNAAGYIAFSAEL